MKINKLKEMLLLYCLFFRCQMSATIETAVCIHTPTHTRLRQPFSYQSLAEGSKSLTFEIKSKVTRLLVQNKVLV